MWSHSDLTHVATPAQCLCCIEGGRGKQHHFLPTWHIFFHSSALPNRPSLSFFLWTPILAPASPATVEQIVSVFHAASKQKAMGPFLQSPTQEPGHVAKASRGWCFHFFKWMCSCFTSSALGMQYVTVSFPFRASSPCVLYLSGSPCIFLWV